MAMSLDGLRAWIGMVERKLTMRTRVFLVLVAIAIGGAAAGIVLAVDAQNNSVSKDDLQSVRDELAGTSAPAATPQTAELEAQIETLRGEIAALRSASEAQPGSAKEPTESDNGGATAPQDQQQLKEAGEEALEKSQDKHK
jgi:hypothetical protein